MKKYLLVLAFVMCFSLMASTPSFAEEKGVSSESTPKETGNVVSKAVHEAQAEGLKGQELAGRAHQAIQERKETRITEKGKKKETKVFKQKKFRSGTKIQSKGKGKK